MAKDPILEKLRYTFYNMKARCSDPENSRYGGKGVIVEWSCYAAFRDDMKASLIEAIKAFPGECISIDRIDSAGNYSRENCQWITLSENSRKDVLGKKKTAAHRSAMSAERKGKPQSAARARVLSRLHKSQRRPVVGVDGSGVVVRFESMLDAERELGIRHQNIQEICSGSNMRRKTAGGYRWEYA